MAVDIIKGNIFTSNAQTLVNTVNCVGVMGAGLALEMRLRYPDMYDQYVDLCNKQAIVIGQLWIYRSPDRWILNFPTKKHWRNPSKKQYLAHGLEQFIDSYKREGIKSIAFPTLGADKGGLKSEESIRIMRKYLDDVEVIVEVYRYDPHAYDDCFVTLRDWLSQSDTKTIADIAGIRPEYVDRVVQGIEEHDIRQLNQLIRVRGVGIKTIERLFRIASRHDNSSSWHGERQLGLW